ncbi:MAG: hypothetical protein WBB23_06905 [Desulforhopalus sp.]
MAGELKGCKTCGKDVAKFARKCPHCGQPNPAVNTKGCCLGSLLTGMVFIIALGFLAGGGDEKTATIQQTGVDATQIIIVSEFDYAVKGEQAVSISFGETETNWCSATISREYVKVGFKTELHQNSSGNLSIGCNWDGQYFVQSSKHPTLTSLSINTLDSASKTAEIDITAKLVNPHNDTYLDIGTQRILISGVNFDHLTKR